MKFVPNNLYTKYADENLDSRSWALVTGATDGIGLAICKVLAKDHGFNILMVSRNAEKLENKKKEVLEYCGNKVQVNCET